MIWTVFNQFSCKIRNKFIWHGERWMETSNFSSLVFVSKFVSFYRLILKCKQFAVVMIEYIDNAWSKVLVNLIYF